MRLDTQRVYVLVLKAMKMAKANLEGTNRSRWVGPGRENDENWNDICTPIDHDLRREQLEYDNLKKESQGRERDTLHAFHAWEKCLRSRSRNMDKSRNGARDIQQQCVADTAKAFMDLTIFHELLEWLDLKANAGD